MFRKLFAERGGQFRHFLFKNAFILFNFLGTDILARCQDEPMLADLLSRD